MKSTEFIAKLRDIAAIRTTYMWGMFGGPVTEARITEKVKQYPKNYSAAKQARLRGMIGKNVYAFDCIGLIKGVLWGWNADPNPLGHGGAKYASNGVPDIDANVAINRCKDVSADFSKIVPGSAVWLPGHIGVYIGDGKVIEATPSWQDGVQITACLNIAPIAGLNGRKWVKHGKLPWIDYVAAPTNAINTFVNLDGKRYPTVLKDSTTYMTAKTFAEMVGGDSLIPLRAIAEAMGYHVQWIAATKETHLKDK
jgi:hypothetical protein